MTRKFISISTLLLLLFATPSLADNWFTDHTSLNYNLTFSPPHNEPVVGNQVARYRLQLNPEITFKYARYDLEFDVWGTNQWRNGSTVGNGSEAWDNSDWSIDKYRLSLTHKVHLGPETLHIFTEYYMPIDRKSWGGHGMETNYYWLVGFGGTLW